MRNLFGLDREGLRAALEPYDVPGFHAGQIFRWLYQRHELEPARWTDLPVGLRERIRTDFSVTAGRLRERTTARDGTVKYLIAPAGGDAVEAVFMVQSGRVTLCLSSQVGCALACDFCLTGRMGLRRNLDAGEIAGQAALIRADQGLAGRPFNVVFMGMGEPLHNYDAVLAAFRLLTDAEGPGLSRRRVTVSTVGLVPAIERLAAEPLRPRLAVSLNATTDALRDRLMPINRRHPIASLRRALLDFAGRTGDDFTFEYVLLAGVNDTDEDVARLERLSAGLPVRVNLIPFNEVPGLLPYRAPRRERVLAIRDRLLERGRRASIRWSRGADARAACGQLALFEAAGAGGRR